MTRVLPGGAPALVRRGETELAAGIIEGAARDHGVIVGGMIISAPPNVVECEWVAGIGNKLIRFSSGLASLVFLRHIHRRWVGLPVFRRFRQRRH